MNQFDFTDDYQNLIQNQETRGLLSNPLLKKDIWHTVDDLGLKVNEHQKTLTINFSDVKLDWFRFVVKLYILVRSRLKLSPGYLKDNVSHLKRFSRFLEANSVYSFDQIDNQTFDDFDYYLRSLNISKRTISLHYVTLKNFFDTCRLEGWVEINTYWFNGRRTGVSTPKNDEINYIPEEVWHQLDQNLHHLPEQLQRMVLIIRTTGIRVGELLNLPLDCLRKRGEQWRLRFTTEKYKTEDELPIIPDLVVVIKEQQDYIKDHFEDSYNNLFSTHSGNHRKRLNPQPKVMNTLTFNTWLNKLSKQCNIQSKNGQLWHFSSHQFRRTVGTVMTNAGVRDLIIQKYLRHRSPDMQNHYKHLLKQVLGEEYQELMKDKKYVDISGKVVARYQPSNPITELMRRKMYQITTQYGECHRPILKSPCQTVNACWRCEHWRTSTDDLVYLKDDLKRLNEEINVAESLGMVKQQQGLEDDCNSLVTRIQGLEAVDE
ncbi:tyrosine-type recombinase/integrase [Crocosphaera chwakensis]|uniref:Tn554, transposase B n=1 Tax=Crocosphaera chwakensis CCY0110 TaxID=391612 RepID=A3IMD4_9CHRO|nr:site-specific integrase [Crocosphaera chwakensis]EAZ92303.1 Tn554, transposase B [Crocosphaera chwakensis CCY0110]